VSSQRSQHRVLVVASDAMLAALVGALVETTGLSAVFPQEGEDADKALARVKPLAAVLVNGEEDVAASDVFLRRARKRGVALMLFGKRDTMQRISSWARSNDVNVFVLPAESLALRTALERVPEPTKHRFERRVHAERSESGGLLFFDASGRRWSVYDRRSNDGARLRRQFVSEVGEAFGCDLKPGEESADSAEALESQFAQAKLEA
jgi:hypothetical protein